jgi:hypothetical protein
MVRIHPGPLRTPWNCDFPGNEDHAATDYADTFAVIWAIHPGVSLTGLDWEYDR